MTATAQLDPDGRLKVIGDNIKRLREEKKWSQEMLAEKAKISMRRLQRIENVEAHGRLLVVVAICKALGVQLEDVMKQPKSK